MVHPDRHNDREAEECFKGKNYSSKCANDRGADEKLLGEMHDGILKDPQAWAAAYSASGAKSEIGWAEAALLLVLPQGSANTQPKKHRKLVHTGVLIASSL
jgi:hypothetical protein